MLEQAIQDALESWVERGRNRDEICDGRIFVLRYGRRFMIQHVAILTSFAFFFGLAVVVILQGDRTIASLLCLGLFGFLTVFSTIYLAYAFTSRVVIDDTSVAVRCFGITISECTVESLSTVYKSPIHESVVLQNHNGTKVRVSTQFDGLRALVTWLWLRPRDTLTDSIVVWMNAEAPDLYGECR